MKKYKRINKLLGKGAFGEVYLCEMDNKYYALKKFNDKYQYYVEVDILNKLDHPNIVKIYEHDNIEHVSVMEYCDGGTFNDIVLRNKELSKSSDYNQIEKNTLFYLCQLKDSLVYLRNKGIFHRDLKKQNILLKKSDNGLLVKLCDFGLAKSSNDIVKENNKICGSPLYMAPEFILNGNYSVRSDIWSFGIVMYELLFFKTPYIADSVDQLKENIKKDDISFPENVYSVECINLLKSILIKNHRKRISWNKLTNHIWFKQVASINEKMDYSSLDFYECQKNNENIFMSVSNDDLIYEKDIFFLKKIRTKNIHKLFYENLSKFHKLFSMLSN